MVWSKGGIGAVEIARLTRYISCLSQRQN